MNARRSTTRQIVIFLSINVVLTAVVFALMLSGGGDSMPLVMLMMWTPALSAFVYWRLNAKTISPVVDGPDA